MASDISEALLALKGWEKAVKKYRKKGFVDSEQIQKAEETRQKVLAHLSSTPVSEEIDELIQRAIAPDSTSAADVRETLVKHPEPLISVELKTVHPLAVSHKDLETVIDAFLRTPDDEKPIASSEELKDIFVKLSLIIPQEYKAATKLSRKPKKRRKRDLTLATLLTTIGVGLIIGNSQLSSPASDYSYILGGNALILAVQNLVGSLKDSPDIH